MFIKIYDPKPQLFSIIGGHDITGVDFHTDKEQDTPLICTVWREGKGCSTYPVSGDAWVMNDDGKTIDHFQAERPVVA
jgi:hypothetical protein